MVDEAIRQPSRQVLAAFGASTCDVEFLPGGQGVSFRAGTLVLKPVTNARLHHDIAEVSRCAIAAGAPLVTPVRSNQGSFVVDGWMATRVVSNTGHEWEHADCDWGAVLEAARRLHSALGQVAVPASFHTFRSRSRWAQADAAVWSGELPEVQAEYRRPAHRLLSRLRSVDHDVQIVHGDVCGNVLRRTDRTLLVIDFSPYIRPVVYAEAVIVVDALLWYGAPAATVDHLTPQDRQQMMLRATLFRLLCDGIFHRDHPLPRSEETLASYERVYTAIGGA